MKIDFKNVLVQCRKGRQKEVIVPEKKIPTDRQPKKDELRVANILTRFSDRFYRIFNTAWN